MEQKQIDELDESYFGEEFIDDDSFETIKLDDLSESTSSEEGSLNETSKEKASEGEVDVDKISDKEKNLKNKAIRKRTAKNTKAEKKNKSSYTNTDEILTSKKEIVKDDSSLIEKNQKKVKNDDISKKEEAAKKGTKYGSTLETSKPVNPWADDNSSNNESRIFEVASTWKFITAAMVVLLIISVFTQGFNFSADQTTGAAAVGNKLTLEQAQERVLDYVNTNLLRPPYLAEAVSSAELDDVFKVTLSIADQEVDAYITKDGHYFFPQGFDISFKVIVEEVEKAPLKEVQLEELENKEEIPTDKVVEDKAEEVVVPAEETKTFSLTAKKWLFSLQQLEVNTGDTVVLTIEPEGFDFTFAIPGLGVEQAVSGTTTVKFTAGKSGEFEFKCSSCESWRGMTGTLVVK